MTGPALKEVNRVGKQFEDGVQRFDGAFGAARESDEDQRPGPHRSTTLPGRIAGRERPTGRGWDGRAHRKGDFVSTHPRCPMGTRGSASAPAGLAAEEGPEKVGVSVQLPRLVSARSISLRVCTAATISTDRLRSAIKRLRRKLGDHAAGPAYIFNQHGVDYRVPEQEER